MSLPATTSVGSGVAYGIEGDKLFLVIDIGDKAQREAPPSASGKMRMLGTTHGFATVRGGIKVSLNVGVKA